MISAWQRRARKRALKLMRVGSFQVGDTFELPSKVARTPGDSWHINKWVLVENPICGDKASEISIIV